MNLTDIKKKADAKIAEAKAKQEEARRLRELDIHPLVKWKCDRNVREAYFQGVVFAALSNDLKIDEAEQKILSRIGNSLAIPKDEQIELTTLVQNAVDAAVEAGGANVFVPLEESVQTLKSENIVALFVAEFVKVCGSRSLDEESVREQLKDYVIPKSGVILKPAFASLLYRVVKSGKDVSNADLADLAKMLGNDVVRYYMLDAQGDCGAKLAAEQEKREHAERVRKEAAQKKLDAENAIHQAYDNLSKVASRWVKAYDEDFSQWIYGKLQDEVSEILLGEIDYQTLFLEVGERYVSRIEALKIPEIPEIPEIEIVWANIGRGVLHSLFNGLKKADIEKLENAKMCARETAWILLGLVARKGGVSIRIGRTKDMLSSYEFRYYMHDAVHMWKWLEDYFCSLLGVESVYPLIFKLTDEQRTQLQTYRSEMLRLKGRVKEADFLAYALSIGIRSSFPKDDLIMASYPAQ